MQMIENAADSAKIAETALKTGEVYFVPAFSGLYAPYWRKDARRYNFPHTIIFSCAVFFLVLSAV